MTRLADPVVRDRLGVVAVWVMIVLVFLPIGAVGLAMLGFWSGELGKALVLGTMVWTPRILLLLGAVALIAGGIWVVRRLVKRS